MTLKQTTMSEEQAKYSSNMDDIREAFLEAMKYCNKKGLEWQKHVKPFISKGELRGYNVESGNTILKEIKV